MKFVKSVELERIEGTRFWTKRGFRKKRSIKEENLVRAPAWKHRGEYGEGEKTRDWISFFAMNRRTIAISPTTVRYFIVAFDVSRRFIAILANFLIDRALKPENIASLTVAITYFGLPVDACFQDAAIPRTFQALNPSQQGFEFWLSSLSLARPSSKALSKVSKFRIDRDDNVSTNSNLCLSSNFFGRFFLFLLFSFLFFFFSAKDRARSLSEIRLTMKENMHAWLLSVATTFLPRERNKCVSSRFSFDILSRSSLSPPSSSLYLCAFSLTMDQRAVLRAHTCAVLKERWRTSFLACITVCIGFVDSQYVQVACSGTGECQCHARVARHEKREHIYICISTENSPTSSVRRGQWAISEWKLGILKISFQNYKMASASGKSNGECWIAKVGQAEWKV